MNEITLTSSVSKESIDAIVDHVSINLDYGSIADLVFEHFDIDNYADDMNRTSCENIVTRGLGDNFFETVYENIQDDIASLVDDSMHEKLQDYVEDAVDEHYVRNGEDHFLENLSKALQDYLPISTCDTGILFTNAVHSAVTYLLESSTDFKETLGASLNSKNVVVENEPVPIFNPDLMGVISVVSALVEYFGFDIGGEDKPSFLVDLQMSMWQCFVVNRTSYVDEFNRVQNEKKGLS